ncbi:hypothetical protein F383_33369 [Gossypium arboreum]|uniref:Uncharacterized protein n=1 Tax=Gossypium arboreum TaxID=29729 RepID=A0A0B0N7D1_GOSAR|nr:hypothetical protein F383_33794 [Gossypium arboreum]KHG07021.1 hypothetical protein F383_33369 [Gossypium arboreum]
MILIWMKFYGLVSCESVPALDMGKGCYI